MMWSQFQTVLLHRSMCSDKGRSPLGENSSGVCWIGPHGIKTMCGRQGRLARVLALTDRV